MIFSSVAGSSPEVGSSKKMIEGLVNNSTATEMRLRCPPESWPTATLRRSARPVTSKTSPTIRSMSASNTSCDRRRRAT